jgi:hypothetical protein
VLQELLNGVVLGRNRVEEYFLYYPKKPLRAVGDIRVGGKLICNSAHVEICGRPEAPETDAAVFDLLARGMCAQRDDLVSATQQCSSNGQQRVEVPGTGGGGDESFHGSCLSEAQGVTHPLAVDSPLRDRAASPRQWRATLCGRDGE